MAKYNVNAYMKQQRRLNQNLEESDSDKYDSYDDKRVTNETRDNEEEDQMQDSKPTAQERRLGFDINMRGAREPNLGSTRS